MDDVIGQGRDEPGRDPRPPLPRYWRFAAWVLVGAAAGLGILGLGLRHGSGAPGSSRARPTAPATWAVAQGGVVGAAVAGVQAQSPVLALAATAGGPGMFCSPSTGACSVLIRSGRVVAAPAAPAASEASGAGVGRLGLRAPSLWDGL